MGRMKCLLLFVAIIAGLTASPVSAAEKYISFGGGGPGGNWYIVTGGVAPLLTREIEGLNVVSQATEGDLENAMRLAAGEIDMTINHAPTLYNLYNAKAGFKDKKPAKNIRLMCTYDFMLVSICVLAKSDIYKLSDLVGKKIAVGNPGGGTVRNAQRLFGALGMWDKIEPRYMSFADGATALKEGHVDVLFQNGAPVPNVISVEATHKIRLIGLTEEEAKIFKQKYPAFTVRNIEPKTYETIDYPVRSFGNLMWFATTDRVEEKWIYEIVKSLFTAQKENRLSAIHKRLSKNLSPSIESGRELGIPFHQGAIKYYKEKGLW